jgi:hypothetical protein
MTGSRWIQDIRGGLSIPVLVDYVTIWDKLSSLQLQEDREDRWAWRWTADGRYSAASAYKLLHSGGVIMHGAERIWKSWAPPKVKFFTWLAIKRRIWTADRRHRHGTRGTRYLLACDQENETCNHLLVSCSYAKEVWWAVLSGFSCQCKFTPPANSLSSWWVRLRNLQPRTKRKGMNSLFMLVIWSLWKERNARLFKGSSTAAPELVQKVRQELQLWVMTGANKLGRLVHE